MITKNIIDYCENCGAAYIVESDSETWETRTWWSQDCPYGEHEREQFPSYKTPILAPPVQQVIDDFKAVTWQNLKNHRPTPPKFKRGV